MWKKRSGKRGVVGSVAGYKSKSGYIQVSLEGVKDLAHRVIWRLMTGEIPKDMQIDHINHKRDDNRWINLRLVTSGDNCKNKTLMANNTSSMTGVCWHKRDLCWVSSIGVEGKLVNLGNFKTEEEALKARKLAEIKYGYHENNGKREVLSVFHTEVTGKILSQTTV